MVSHREKERHARRVKKLSKLSVRLCGIDKIKSYFARTDGTKTSGRQGVALRMQENGIQWPSGSVF